MLECQALHWDFLEVVINPFFIKSKTNYALNIYKKGGMVELTSVLFDDYE
jgi:hypothetical protein